MVGGDCGCEVGGSIHAERFKDGVFQEGFSQAEDLVLEFVPQGGAAGRTQAGKGALHAAFVVCEESALAFGVEKAGFPRELEMLLGLEGAMTEQVKGEGIGHWRTERLDQVKGKGGTVVFRLVVEALGWVESVSVQ